MDIKYWDSYYKTNKKQTNPSPFAKYLGENYLNNQSEKKTMIELGCGDGRDAVYFGEIGINIIGVDQSNAAVTNLNNNYSNENVRFIEDDFTNFESIFDEKFDYIYSRFTIHAVKEESEDKVLEWAYNNLKEGGIFFIEVRSTEDDLFGKGVKIAENTYKFNEHNRRFVDFETLKGKMKNYSKTLESRLEKGLAVHGDADPKIIRLIVQK